MAETHWDQVFAVPATIVGDRPLALLDRLAELLTALRPQDLDPNRSNATGARRGGVSVTFWHQSEALLQFDLSCNADGFVSINTPVSGPPEEVNDPEDQSVDDWSANVLEVVTDILESRYTLTEYRRGQRLVRTRISSDSPQIGITVADRWTGLLRLTRRNLETTTRTASYDCRGTPPHWLLRSAIFVIGSDGIITVYPHRSHAEASLDAIDIAAGEYRIAYDERGVAYDVKAHLDNGRLVPAGKIDPRGLTAALRAWPNGPINLADDPHAYAVHQLTTF